MPTMNIIQAVNSALDHALGADEDVFVFGEDVGKFGGVFRATDGLQEAHGEQRRALELHHQLHGLAHERTQVLAPLKGHLRVRGVRRDGHRIVYAEAGRASDPHRH